MMFSCGATHARPLDVFDQDQPRDRCDGASLMGAGWPGGNEDPSAFGVRDHPATEVDFERAGHDEADVAFFAPVGLDELRGELDETKLLRAVPMDLEPRSPERGLPGKGVEVDIDRENQHPMPSVNSRTFRQRRS